MEHNKINFTAEKLAKLKKEYRKAVDGSQESFMFDGAEYYTQYAKYLIEYLDACFKIQKCMDDKKPRK